MKALKEGWRPALKQKLPEELIGGLMGIIRGQFAPDVGDKEWFKDYFHFIRRRVVLWPAAFMVKEKRFTVSPERYEQILLGILEEIKQKGNTAAVRSWPAYLTKCVQSHFEHNWETYYREAKAVVAQADRALLAMRALPEAGEGRAVEAMAMAHAVLTSAKKPVRRAAPAPTQRSLFDL